MKLHFPRHKTPSYPIHEEVNWFLRRKAEKIESTTSPSVIATTRNGGVYYVADDALKGSIFGRLVEYSPHRADARVFKNRSFARSFKQLHQTGGVVRSAGAAR